MYWFAVWSMFALFVQQPKTPSGAAKFEGPYAVGQIQGTVIDEASGLVASRIHNDLLWTHNDSGDDPRIFALSTKGAIQCTVRLKGASNVDYEDIAIGPGPEKNVNYLYVADIGDNESKRANIIVYRFAEPNVSGKTSIDVTPERIQLTYPDGARDAEALFIDPATQDLYIITKREMRSRVYRAKAPLEGGVTRRLDFVTDLPINLVTAADISSTGNEVLVKNYTYTYYWRRTNKENFAAMFKRVPAKVTYMPEPQGEAVCFAAADAGFYTISERPSGELQTSLHFYAPTAYDHLKDPSQPSIRFGKSQDTDGIYDLTYTVPTESKVTIITCNEAMMKIKAEELGNVNAGEQTTEIDLRDRPSGTYIVVATIGKRFAAVVIEHKGVKN